MSIFDHRSFGRRGIRFIRQTEVTECGLASIAMVANYHGLEVDLGTLRREHGVSARGATLRTLISIADRLGFTSRAVKLPMEAIAGLQLPAVLHWNLSHFVVLERLEGNRAYIHDPAERSRWLSLGELSKNFTGIALEIEPASEFEPADRRNRLRLRQLWHRMTGIKRAVLQTIVLSLVMQAFVLASPYFMQLAVDQALPALDAGLLAVLAIGFGLFTLINVAASMTRSLVLLAAGTSLSFGVAANLGRRLLRLPVSWFEKRHVGDVLSRFQSVHPIQRALTEGAVAALLDGALALLTLAMMFFYSPLLTLVALTALGAYTIARLVSFPYQRAAQEETIIAHGKEQSVMIETVRGIVTLRLFNRESSRHAVWLASLSAATNATVGLARIGIFQQSANALILGLEIIAAGWISIHLVMSGGFSLGMVFAYFAYKTLFLTRSASLLDELIAFRMLGLHLERLSDIALGDEDRSFNLRAAQPRAFAGRIELHGVSFRYAPSEPLVLDRVNLVVEAGEHVAITGRSGGGKTTLVKILLGLLEPVEGEILVDGIPLLQFGIRNYQEQVAAVLQEDSLFAGSLADNIALFDDAPEGSRIVRAAIAAAIHEDITAMPMGYETRVGDMGSALSGGQKQRILLARALYREPKLLVMDEGTAHLDAATERAVNAGIAELGITRIIIAHRRETIAAAERIHVTSQGKLTPLPAAPQVP